MSTETRELASLAALAPRSLTVLFDVSNKCNLRCRFCYFSYDSVFQRPAMYLAPERFERIATTLLPLAHTLYLSAGSESLTHPRFTEILAVAARHCVPTTKLLTNGLLLTPALIDALIEYGLSELHVSLDGATAATYEHMRRGGSFEKLLANLRALRDRKRALRSSLPRLQFNLTLMRCNLPELERFVDLGLELGVERIAARHLMPYEGLEMESELTSADPLQANQRFHALLEHATRSGLDVTSFPDFYAIDGEPWTPPPAVASAPAGAPLGHVDQPPEAHARAHDSILLAGWALSPGTLREVVILRPSLASDPAGLRDEQGWVRVGSAHISNATRPDVARLHSSLPQAYRAGWSFEVRADALPSELRNEVELRVVALDHAGVRTCIGARTLHFGADVRARRFLYCRKPFDNVYVDAHANVYPYPDCQAVDPFGSLAANASFQSIWLGPAFEDLRRRIVERDPPRMCLTCPDFINRNVDDPAYFRSREVEPALRRPLGFLDQPGRLCISAEPRVKLRGWALGYSPVVRIEILREPFEGERPAQSRPDGKVLLGTAAPGTEERADVAAAHPRFTGSARAGWSFELDASGLPHHVGLQLCAVAWNEDGLSHVLGTSEVRFVGDPA